MADANWLWHLDTKIPSDYAEGHRVQEEILSRLEKLEWIRNDLFGIRLSMEEALVNAIKHGNQLDVEKQVHVTCQIGEQRIVITITDEGHGFDPEAVPDCTQLENLERPCGRGIKLMRSFMSRVEYNPRGNRVVLEKLRVDGSTN